MRPGDPSRNLAPSHIKPWAVVPGGSHRRARRDAKRGDSDEELALMQDDRDRLAVELDSALSRNRVLDAFFCEGSRFRQSSDQLLDSLLTR